MTSNASFSYESTNMGATSVGEKKQWHPLIKGFSWGLSFAATATISAMVGASLIVFNPLMKLTQEDGQGNLWKSMLGYDITRPVNILVMGIDRGDPLEPISFDGRSDTILLLRFEPATQEVHMLSIPRDTRVEGEGLSLPKINQANVDGGPALTAQVLSNKLNGVQIDRYVRITTEAFIQLVDLLGGIEVYVPQKMHYVDQTQKLNIDLEEGWQTLNGDQAEQFARFRGGANGDIGRVQRQQSLLKAVKKKLQSPAIIPQIPEMLNLFQQYIDTNLSTDEMLALGSFSLKLKPEGGFQMVMLPGRFSQPEEYQLSYWLMDEQGKDTVMANYFSDDPNSRNNTEQGSPTWAKIYLQNTTEIEGLAGEMATYLQQQDFRNVHILEDSSESLKKTEIVVQRGDFATAKILKQALNVGTIDASAMGGIDGDITIKIGTDWNQVLKGE